MKPISGHGEAMKKPPESDEVGCTGPYDNGPQQFGKKQAFSGMGWPRSPSYPVSVGDGAIS